MPNNLRKIRDVDYMKSVSCNKYETLFITGWVQRSETHRFINIWWVSLRCIHPTFDSNRTGWNFSYPNPKFWH